MVKEIEKEFEELEDAVESVVFVGSKIKPHKVFAWSLFWGLIFLLGATAAILGALGIISYGINIGWVLLAILLVAIAIASLVKLNWFGFFMPIAGIMTVIATQTEYFSVFKDQIWMVWLIALLLTTSFSILFHRRRCPCPKKSCSSAKSKSVDDKNVIKLHQHFGEITKYIESQNLEKVEVDFSFSGAKLYFDNAKLAKNNAVLDLDLRFSGLELYVPRDWAVIDDCDSKFGGVSEKHRRRCSGDNSKNTLTLTGEVKFSGVEINYI